MKLWTNFIVSLLYISRLLQKFHFPKEIVLNSLQTSKGFELVFRAQFLKSYLIKIVLFQYDINWSNLIIRMCSLPKFFTEMYFFNFLLGHLITS